MASTQAHRITALETRVSEIETSHGELIYQLRRDSVETRIGIRMILDHLGLPRITEERIDEALDQA